MIFLLFLASVATIEVILRHDEGKKSKIKPPAATVSEYDVASSPTAESVLALRNTLDQHGRGQVPAIDTEVAVSKHADRAHSNDVDKSFQSHADRGEATQGSLGVKL